MNKLEKHKIEIYDESNALEKYKKALFDSVEKCVRGQKRIGIIFSGGVDSVMIAQIAKLLGADITCYTSGFSDSPDVINSKRAAQYLGFELRANELTDEKIEQELKNIIASIESTDHLQVDVAIPVFFAAKLVEEDSIKVILNGQGADELFAGYDWYPDVLKEKGGDFLNDCLWNDLNNAYKETFEREEKIAKYHSLELRVPYVDPEVIKIAMSISEKLKIKNNEVKYIHRKLADDVGVPHFIAWRPKEAAQYGSNVHDKLIKILEKKKKEMPPQKLRQKILPLKVEEKLGSVYRYSPEVYEDKDIQKILDFIGAEIGVY